MNRKERAHQFKKSVLFFMNLDQIRNDECCCRHEREKGRKRNPSLGGTLLEFGLRRYTF